MVLQSSTRKRPRDVAPIDFVGEVNKANLWSYPEDNALHRSDERIPSPEIRRQSDDHLNIEKVSQEIFPFRGKDRFRMKLHAEDRVLDMRQTHDLVLLSPCSDLQALGKAVSAHHQGMVAGRFNGLGNPEKTFSPSW